MLPRHFALLILISLLGLIWSQNNDFLDCYDGNGVPQRCEPRPISFTLGRAPVVNSTCGDPPESFCLVKLVSDQLRNECSYECNASDPALAHPAEHMTDFFPETEPTWWQSRNGIYRPRTVVINITLGSLVQVQSVAFQFPSLKPDSFYILKSTDNGRSYEPWHYFSRDCITRYGINPQADLTMDNETEVLCQRIARPDPGQIIFSPTSKKPSDNDFIPGLSDVATDIAVVLDGHTILDGLDNTSYHYAISDINIKGMCACNGHAMDCQRNSAFPCHCKHNTTGPNCEKCSDTHNDIPWQIANGNKPFECKACQCNEHATTCVFDQALYEASGRMSGGRCVNCSDNTNGPHCDSCAPLYYPQSGVPVNNTNHCQSCSCNMAGVTDNGDCVREDSGNLTVGSCYCKPNVMGRACDTCKPGFFNLQTNNTDGCEVCSCNSILSVPLSCLSMGVCECQPNVVGIRCDRCADGFYLADPSGASGCSPCSCNLGGSFAQNCNMTTGQCSCRPGVTGHTCSQSLPGYYYPFMDHKIFEAEESTGIFTISFAQNQLFTGRGFAHIDNYTDLIHFGVFQPQVSGVYELVVRFNLLMTLEQAELRVDVAGEGAGPAANCTEYTGSPPVFYQRLDTGIAKAASLSLCLRAGRSYNLTLSGFMTYHSKGQVELFVDSLVVFLQQTTVLVTLTDTQTAMQYSNCLTQFESLGTYSKTPMILSTCEAISFTVFTEVYNGTRRCDCNSLGSFNKTCQQYGGQCFCQLNVIGRACDLCAAGSYDLSPTGCRDCACDPTGSTSEFCSINGECSCLPGVTGRDCSQCTVGFYNLVAEVGCSDCGCSLNGSVSSQCNETGLCGCITGVGGDNCTQCLTNRYDYPNCRECGCNEAGSTDLQCDLQDGQCPCKINTEGSTCSQCKKGTFNLHTANPNGCQQCFCSGRGDSCTSATGFIFSEIFTNFSLDLAGWTLIDEGSSFDNDIINKGIIINSTNTTYLQAPAEYLGNKVTSYNQFITLTVVANGDELSCSDGYDVLIAGNELELVANFSSYIPSAQTQDITVHLHDTARWVHRQSGTLATMRDLQTVLVNLSQLQVRVSLREMVMLSSISMGGASLSTEPSSSQVSWVENCTCTYPNYIGLSCEQCANGYYRDTVNRLCVLCECNGLSYNCDKQSGACINCSANTTGDHCERCGEGYYGNPLANVPCQECPCPSTTTSGQFSNTCMLQNGTTVYTNCVDGHVGDHCEMCDVVHNNSDYSILYWTEDRTALLPSSTVAVQPTAFVVVTSIDTANPHNNANSITASFIHSTPMITPSIPPNSISDELLTMIIFSVFICIILSVCLIAYGICNMVAKKCHKQRSLYKSKNSDQTELVCTSNEDSAAVPEMPNTATTSLQDHQPQTQITSAASADNKPQDAPMVVVVTTAQISTSSSRQNRLDEKPDMATLNYLEYTDMQGKKRKIRISEEIAAKWMQIGQSLHLSTAILNNIDATYCGEVERCCKKMLTRWLGEGHVEDDSELKAPVIWNTLLKALKDAKFGELVNNLTEFLTSHDNEVPLPHTARR